MSVPTYAYANNNPLAYTDPTGLYSWRVSCPALGAINRGVVVTGLDDSIIRRDGMGVSGLDTKSNDACEDFDAAVEIEAANKDDPAFWLQRDCWRALKLEILKYCAVPVNRPKLPKHPPAGYCSK